MIYEYILIIAGASLLSVLLTLATAKLMRAIGKIGIDIHKPEYPEIPESVGLSISLTLTIIVGVILFTLGNENEAFDRLLPSQY